MKIIALLAVVSSCLTYPVVAQIQGFRGVPGGTRNSGGSVQVAPPTTQPRQGFANGQAGNPVPPFTASTPRGVYVQRVPHGALVQPVPQGTHIYTVPPVIVPKIMPNPNHRGVAIVAPLPVHRRPTVAIVGVVPHHHHRPWFFYQYPGAAIVEWPYVYSPTVFTQVAPGVISTAPRYTEEPPSEARTRGPGQLAPFDPTPQEVVERMLALANVKSGDVLYDLGAGDGRVVITAAKKYGIRAVGVEIDPGLAKLARENARQQGVEQLVEIRQQDFLTADLSGASVVTLYLSYDGNLALRPQLIKQLKPGARVVSYTFDMGEWQPKISETYRDGGGDAHVIYLWDMGGIQSFGQFSAHSR